MNEAKEFQGKNLDEAIEAACKHFDLKRDKLEIEIISGGSSGIFGLVGVKKAVIRAKPRGSLKLTEPERPERRQETPAERPEPAAAPAPAEEEEAASAEPGAARPAEPAKAREPRGEKPRRTKRSHGRGERDGNRVERPAPDVDGNRLEPFSPDVNGNRLDSPVPDIDGNRSESRPAREGGRRRRPRREPERAPRPAREPQPRPQAVEEEPAPSRSIADLDPDKVVEEARTVTQHLIEPLVENAQIAVSIQDERVRIRIDDPANSGLLIGREGQTLAAIQYLVNRLVSKRLDASVRVQIDAGDYRESQDEHLRQIARRLADKAAATGRTQSTRPMSSYHRRVVHLALQDDPYVFTRSKGEGATKRVLIIPKRKEELDAALAAGPSDVNPAGEAPAEPTPTQEVPASASPAEETPTETPATETSAAEPTTPETGAAPVAAPEPPAAAAEAEVSAAPDAPDAEK